MAGLLLAAPAVRLAAGEARPDSGPLVGDWNGDAVFAQISVPIPVARVQLSLQSDGSHRRRDRPDSEERTMDG